MGIATSVTQSAPAQRDHVQGVVAAAERELQQLLQQRAETMKRIGTVKQTLAYLAKAFGEDVLSAEGLRLLGRGTTRKQPGFTRACRAVLMEASIPLDARQGLRELQRRFPELVERHKDPLAAVTTVFNRLVGYAEARSFPNGKGRRVWEWIAEAGGVTTSVPLIENEMSRQSTITRQ